MLKRSKRYYWASGIALFVTGLLIILVTLTMPSQKLGTPDPIEKLFSEGGIVGLMFCAGGLVSCLIALFRSD